MDSAEPLLKDLEGVVLSSYAYADMLAYLDTSFRYLHQLVGRGRQRERERARPDGQRPRPSARPRLDGNRRPRLVCISY